MTGGLHVAGTCLVCYRPAPEKPTVVRYEADSAGRIYVEESDGSVWPTGRLVPSLAGRSQISPAEFVAAQQRR